MEQQKPVTGDCAAVVVGPFFLLINRLVTNERNIAGKHNPLNVERAGEQIANIAHTFEYRTEGALRKTEFAGR